MGVKNIGRIDGSRRNSGSNTSAVHSVVALPCSQSAAAKLRFFHVVAKIASCKLIVSSSVGLPASKFCGS